MPLVNIPLIDYSLDFLAASGVEEIILFCCSFSQQIQEHISKSGLTHDIYSLFC
jgi:translation initiation factor eIF-2B subunit epsilon